MTFTNFTIDEFLGMWFFLPFMIYFIFVAFKFLSVLKFPFENSKDFDEDKNRFHHHFHYKAK
jgi:phosphatidylglycerophosphatase A